MEPTPQQPSTKLTLKERLAAVKQAREADSSTQATPTEEAKSVEPMEPADAPVQEQPKTDRELTLKEKLAEAKARRGQATTPQPTGDPQLPLPMETKKGPEVNLTSIPASKKKVRVPAYVRKHLDKTADGEPLLYITQAPNQGSGINFSKHKAKIKANFLKEEKERLKKMGKDWNSLPDVLKKDLKKTAERKADKLLNNWIDEQRGTETVWVKGDPAYEKDELIKKAENSLAYRAWAPFEALIFPQQTEVITKTDVGKTFQQMNDFEGALGWLAYLGRFAPTTLVSTAIAGGGWGTPEQIKAIKGGKDILSYTPDLGDWITDHAENMGLISEETSNHWWTNAITGGLITVPLMLAEPDILTPVLSGAGMLMGGPQGAAGGFLASKGGKGLKALPVLRRLTGLGTKAGKAKKVLAEVAEESSEIKSKEASKVLHNLTGPMGRVVRNTLSTVLSTNPISAATSAALGKSIDEIQAARKAAPEVVKSLDRIDNLTEALAKGTAKEEGLVDLIKGNEEAALQYYQSRYLTNKLLDEELQLNRRLANNYSQFKPKQQSAKAYREITESLNSSYQKLESLEKKINLLGATGALLKQRSKLMSQIQKGQRVLSKANAEQALQIANKRADDASALVSKAKQDLDTINKLVDKAASPDIAESLQDLRKVYRESEKAVNRARGKLEADVFYDAVVDTLDDVLQSTNALKKNLGVKAKDFGVPELRSALKVLRGTDKIDEVVTLLDRAFGVGEFATFVEKSGVPSLSSVIDGTAKVIDPELYGDLQAAIKLMVREGVEKQKADLGIELGEQLLTEGEFMRRITNFTGLNFMAKGAELFANFKNPARKKYGAPAEDIVSSGRARDSLVKRSQSEIGEVFTSKVLRDDNFTGSKANILEEATAEINKFLNPPDPKKAEAMGEHAAAVLRALNKTGESLSHAGEKNLLQKFLNAPDDAILELITEGAIKRRRIKDLMTTTKGVRMWGNHYTMTNLGKSSWWDLSKSWWRRVAVAGEKLRKSDKTFELFLNTFIGRGNTNDQAEALVGVAESIAKKILEKEPDIDFVKFTAKLRNQLTYVGQKPGSLFKVAAESDRLLAMQAGTLSAASSQERAAFDILRRVGGFSADDVADWASFIAGKGGEVKNLRKVLNIANRYGIPISRDAYNVAAGQTSAALKEVRIDGKFALIPTMLIDSISDNLGKITKELAEFNPKGDQPGLMLTNALSGTARLWRTSLTTGLIFPNPVHFTNIFFGNFSQIWASEDFSTAVRVSSQTLKNFVPYFGRKVDDILIENRAKFGNNRALASTYNASLNPHVNGFFNRALAKDSDKIYSAAGKLIGTWGELRDGAAKNGVLSSFAGTDLREALSKSMKKRVEGGPLRRVSAKILNDIVKGDAYSKFAETIEQRQRVALYLDLIARKGMSPKQAAENVKKALYDWDAPLSKLEADYLNNFFLFWRFWKLSLGQAARHLTDPFVKPPTNTTDLIKYSLFQKSPLSRTLAQSRLAMAAPELAYDKQMSDIQDRIEDGTATDRDRYMALLSMVYPSWRKGGNKVFLYNYPLDFQAADQYSRVFGKDVTHEAVTMPGLTMLDTYGLIFSLLGNLSGVAATSGRLATGWDSEDLETSDVLQRMGDLLIDPVQELANPAVEEILEEIKNRLMGKTYEYRQVKTQLKPSEKWTIGLLDKLLSSGLLEQKVGGDPNAFYASTLLMDIYRLTPTLGTQLSRNFDPFIEVAEQDEYAKGIMHVLRQLTGVAKTYSYNPEKELNRLTYKFRDEASKTKQQEKYKPASEEDE